MMIMDEQSLSRRGALYYAKKASGMCNVLPPFHTFHLFHFFYMFVLYPLYNIIAF